MSKIISVWMALHLASFSHKLLEALVMLVALIDCLKFEASTSSRSLSFPEGLVDMLNNFKFVRTKPKE